MGGRLGDVDVEPVIVSTNAIVIEESDYRRFHPSGGLTADAPGSLSNRQLISRDAQALPVRWMDQGDVRAGVHQKADTRFGDISWKQQGCGNPRLLAVSEMTEDRSVHFRCGERRNSQG